MSKTINQLTEQTTLLDNDSFEIQENAGTSKRVESGTMADFVFSDVVNQTLKGSPTASDILVINDAADSNNPKRITIGSLPTDGISSVSKTGNYTILDGDGYNVIYLSGASSNSTFTLPTLADNQDREITLINLDSTYELTIDGEGAETIDGMTTIELPKKYNKIKIIGQSSEWVILEEGISCQLRLDGYAGYGSTDTKIMRFTNSRENFGNIFSENHSTGYSSNTEGLEITAAKKGKYSIAIASRNTVSGTTFIGFSLNSSQLTTDINSITVSDILGYNKIDSGALNDSSQTWTGVLEKDDVIRIHGNGVSVSSIFLTATYLGG